MAPNNGSGHWLSGMQNQRSTGHEIETKVVGVTFENRQSVVRKMITGEQVRLRREPQNAHDQNAIRVERLDGSQVGYISRVEAAILAHSFDQYGSPVMAVVTAITGGGYQDSSLGVRIKFTVPNIDGQQRSAMSDGDEIDNDQF